ncbi:hypothetical protein SAMN00777080_1884 [Aquiflexum balticum DSM 16537]|uniref:Lipoprotein n=1 Tax=Aquiflexum balticum DSM 16537 TaxID=758820 RepID=A0A1W2H490_9BACT|nr:hypothetical protein [Aquiflexum balticum]SMD43296.1 hypothetical protein SAMN00777080_1884 [Aquiflexum balticum DSM 16537]
MKQIIIILFFLTLSAGCAPANLALLGDDWYGHQKLEVSGRTGILINQKLFFGEFHTPEIRRSWTRGGNSYSGIGFGNYATGEYLNIIGTEYIERKQTIRFDLSDGGLRTSSVFCVSKFQAADLLIGNDRGILSVGIDLLELKKGNSSSVYFAQIYTPNAAEPWQLILDNDRAQRHPKTYAGTISMSNGDYYTIYPVSSILSQNGKALQMPFGSMGLEIRDQSGYPLAAVNLADKGQVYFVRGLDQEERFLMANICTALLLQELIG